MSLVAYKVSFISTIFDQLKAFIWVHIAFLPPTLGLAIYTEIAAHNVSMSKLGAEVALLLPPTNPHHPSSNSA